MQRILPLEPPYSEKNLNSFNIVMPAGVPPLNIFRAVGRNERVLSRMASGGLLDKGSISIMQRELLILRVCANCKAEYEWGVHVAAFAEKAGFTAEQVGATCIAHKSQEIWSDEQILLLRLADELCAQSTVSDELWHELAGCFSEEQLVELLMLAGLYHAVSFVVNGLKVDHEKFAPKFPEV